MNEITPEVAAHFSASSARGQVINVIASLETHMDIFLSQHFCSTTEKQDEMLELIFCRMGFRDKLQVFKFIIDNFQKDWGKKYSNFNADLGKLYDERNILAHYPLDTSPEGIDYIHKSGKVLLIKFKNKTNREEFDEVRINKNLKQALNYSTAIGELITIV